VSWIGQDTAHSVSPSLQVLPTDYSVDIHQALSIQQPQVQSLLIFTPSTLYRPLTAHWYREANNTSLLPMHNKS